MSVNRRGFLKTLATALAGASVDPEKLLWTPGAKLISIPKRNLLLTPEEITRRILDQWKANSIGLFNPPYDLDTWYRTGRIGDTISIRRPPRFMAITSRSYRPENIVERVFQVTLK